MPPKSKNSVRSKKSKNGILTEVSTAQPLDTPPKPEDGNEQQNPPEGENPASPTSDKAKKKKKMTAKERKRLRLAEQARQEELQRQAQANLEAERLRELERQMEEQQKQRLLEEETSLNNFRQLKAQNRANVRSEAAKAAEWERYISCDHSTNPLDTADVNTFIAIWKELEDTDMQTLFSHITLASKLIDQLTQYRNVAEVANNAGDFEKFSGQVIELRKLIQNKIELLTQHHLLHSDKYTGAKSEVLLNAESSGYGYGLWVNLAKNPRIKEIDFASLNIGIPKGVAMASLAIRVLFTPFASEFDRYALLSPVMAVEFFQLPPPPKRVAKLVLRQYSQSSGLTPVAYPLKNVSSAQPPLTFKMKIDTSRLPDDMKDVTVIKIDDIERSSELITDVNFDLDEKIVTFNCTTTGIFAVASPKYLHFPFEFWEINSSAPESTEIFLRSSSMEIRLKIDKNGLVSTDHPIQFSGLTASAALDSLQRHGINLVAPDTIKELGEHAEKLCEKPPDLEDVFNSGIADAATGFRIRRSRWNSTIGKGAHEDDRVMFLAREIVEFGEPISEDEAVEEEEVKHEEGEQKEADPTQRTEGGEKKKEDKPTKWACIQGTAKHISIVPNTENSESPIMKSSDENKLHKYLMPSFMDLASDAVKQRVLDSSGFVSETLKYILTKLRLFSMTV